MTINVPKPEVLQAAFANIRANLAYWNQQHWVSANPAIPPPTENTCGTTACLAGHILLAQGLTAEELFNKDVPYLAMKALGFEAEERLVTPDCGCCDPYSGTFWSGDGEGFERIFYAMSDPETGVGFEYSQRAFDAFRKYVSEQTGVEL